MTSINAIRFDRYQGAMVVDETISMGGGLTFHGSDKVRDCVPSIVQEATGMVAGLAGTGTCSFTDAVKRGFHDWLLEEWKDATRRSGGRPTSFHTLEASARGLFDVVVGVKQRKMCERIKGEFGFDVPEFIAGRFQREGATHDLADPELARRLTAWLSYRYQDPEVASIFMNALLLAGYDDAGGFQMFHVDLRDGYWHRVQTCYMAEGSGRFSVDPTMFGLVEGMTLNQRRGEIDRVEGLMTMLAALNSASEHETGVGGYPTVMLFDGRAPVPERQREIGDDRAWLGARAVKACSHGYLHRGDCLELVDGLFFGDLGVEEAWERLWAAVPDRRPVSRLLRGYKLHAR